MILLDWFSRLPALEKGIVTGFILGIVIGFISLIFFPPVDHYKESWRCDRWQFGSETNPEVYMNPFFSGITESDLMLAQYICENLPTNNSFESCQLMKSDLQWRVDYKLKSGSNGSIIIDKEKDCVEWVKVRTTVN